MKPHPSFSRRDFLASMAAAGSAVAFMNPMSGVAQSQPGKPLRIAGFTKPFQKLDFEETADVVTRIGWDGIECPVRKGGQVLPERVEDDLPKLVQSLKKRNLELITIATDIQNASDPLTEKVLRAASKLGIKLYRLAHLRYDRARPILDQLNQIRAGLRELSALNKELGLCAVYENHSGADSVGAPIWDIYELFKDSDPRYYGVCFDIGHATIEGGYTWPTNLLLIQPFLRAVYVKDFAWKKDGKVWKAEWCPLGEGMIDKSFVRALRQVSFQGPIVQHHEYPVGAGSEMIKVMKKDLETLKEWLAG